MRFLAFAIVGAALLLPIAAMGDEVGPASAAVTAANDVALFGKDPGTKTAYACFARRYDTAHLASHPKQNVRNMALLVTSTVDTDQGRQYSLALGVTFRGSNKQLQASGGCGAVDGYKVMTCGIDCDGGRIDVSVKAPSSVMVNIPSGVSTEDVEAQDSPDAPPDKSQDFGSDDKVFRLDRVPMAQCNPLASDEDKAAMAQFK